MPGQQTGPLTGVKVIELTHVMAGPVCGLMLADMGADVIKVERLPGGDSSREDMAYTVDGESAAFMIMNRNKRGIWPRTRALRTTRVGWRTGSPWRRR